MVDPRTPVIVGVGQFTERIDLDGYRGMSSVELATEAARAAVHDCGADSAAVAQAIDTVAGTRQFEISGPQSATLGVSNNYPRSVARNVGAEPARAILEVIGGQSPQHLVTEFAGAIAAGADSAAGAGAGSAAGAGAGSFLAQPPSTSAATKALRASLVFIYRYPRKI